MAVSAQVKQTLASLKGIHATLETFVSVERIPAKKEILYCTTTFKRWQQ
ncbi:MAG: DUF1657 domain-containing protein [Candidatus Syntrophopropionicum ammoniitolerans]